MSQQQTTAIIGLGSMGYGIASSILRAGHNSYGFDVAAQSVERYIAEGGATGDIAEVGASADTVVISCATVPPEFAKDMAARCAESGVHYLDAPISGGSVKAAAGQLSVMASGTKDAFAAAKSALDAMAEKVFELGDEAGAGSAMKAVNQLLAGVHIA